MRQVRHIVSIVFVGLLIAGVAQAAPVIGVTPETIDRLDPSSIEVTASGLSGAELWLRLYVDADQDGLLSEPDYAVWADRVPDNGIEWSPTIPIDQEPAFGTVTLNARLFGPLAFPRTVGHFLWHAEDPFDGSVATVAFEVTQLPETNTVSGRVFDETLAPVAGALVLLQPASTECGEPILSSVADANGDYAIAVPSARTCGFHVVRAGRPGSFATLDDAAIVEPSDGALPDTDLQLRLGSAPTQSSTVFTSGSRSGEGVPGITVFADTAAGAWAVGFSDIDGGVAWSLDGDDWTVRIGDAVLPTLQGALSSADLGADPGVDLGMPASNAFVRGTLTDDAAVALSGAAVAGRPADDCDGDCWTATAVTGFDGRYVLGLLGPQDPAVARYTVEPAAPLDGLLASRLTVELRAGDNAIGRNLDHVAPTHTIRGTVVTADNTEIFGVCVRADGSNAERTARAHTDCDGSYTLPAAEGAWNVRLDTGLAAVILQVETPPGDTLVPVGPDGGQLDFILAPSAGTPFLRGINPAEGPTGTHVVIEGGNFGAVPDVRFDGIPAQIVAVREDLGQLVVKVPAGLAPGVATITLGAQSSSEQCFAVLPGNYTPRCAISGLITRNGGTVRVEGALVVAFDPVTERVERVRVTDSRGRYDLGLDDADANYGLLIYSASGTPRVTGRYPSLPCPIAQGHNLRTGRLVSGRVVDVAGQPIAGVRVDADGVLASATVATRANGTYALRLEEGDNVTIDYTAPPGSRFINDQTLAFSVASGQTVLPDVVLETGSLLAGHVVDPVESALVGSIGADHRATGTPSGAATSNSCDGSFAIALEDGEHRLRLDVSAGNGAADVEWLDVHGDTLAPFAFAVSPATALAFESAEPRLNDGTSMAGHIGQTVVLGIENLIGGDIEAFFTAADGGTIAGEKTLADTGRGLAFTRVPEGATSGDVTVRVNGIDSPPSPFTVLEGPFVQGGFVLRGSSIVGIDPVEGVLALLFLIDPDGLDCDPMGQLHDFDIGDANGQWNLLHPGGDVFVLLLPPREGSRLIEPPLTLAPTYRLFRNEFGNRVFSAFHEEGTPLALRAVAGSPPQPVPNARVIATGRAPDFGMTGSDGSATVYLPVEFPGPTQVDLQILPPLGSRLMLSEFQTAVPDDLGDISLVPGVFVSSQVTEADEVPLVEVTVGGFADGEHTFDTVVRREGVWRGPVPPGGYSVVLETERQDLADALLSSALTPERDRIQLPGVSLPAAGILAGAVRDALTSAPIAGATISVLADEGGTPGAPTAFARTCADGEFRAKVPEGLHFVNTEPDDPATRLGAWFTGGPTDFCPLDAESVFVSPGATTDGVELAVDAPSTLRGTVTVFEDPAVDVVVTATLGRLGSCEATTLTGRDGTFELTVPAGAGYRVESTAPFEVGGPSQCYDGLIGCPSFTPVDTAPLAVTAGIDFSFIAGPPEVSGKLPLVMDKSGDELVLTFERLVDETDEDGYNVYGGGLGAFSTAVESDCYLDPLSLTDDGNGGLVVVLSPDPASEWFLVSASNSAAESSLGPDRVLDNACGAMPPPAARTFSDPR